MAALTVSQVQQVRADLHGILGDELISGHAQASFDDIQRFWRASGHNYKSMIQRLVNTIRWRNSTKPEQIDCSICFKDDMSHYLHVVGHDKLQRPTLYSTFSLANNKAVNHLKEHMIQMFEMATRLMPPGVESWVWLNDFHGFGLSDCNPALALSFLELSASHYPERLGQLLVLDAPSILTPLWNMLKPVIDPVTHKKIVFVSYQPKQPNGGPALSEWLAQLFDEEMQSWVLKEMELVRKGAGRNPTCPRPRYDMQELRRWAADPSQVTSLPGSTSATSDATPSTTNGQTSADQHSHYGCRKLLALLKEQPDVLLPMVAGAGMAAGAPDSNGVADPHAAVMPTTAVTPAATVQAGGEASTIPAAAPAAAAAAAGGG